jgi:NADP-dependent 3-hydroxy acid dehydrogenase YdfG
MNGGRDRCQTARQRREQPGSGASRRRFGQCRAGDAVVFANGSVTFCSSALASFALGPFALGPFALGPFALGPSALGPFVLGPFVLGPFVLGPFVLGPSVLGPSALAPFALGPSALGPSALGPSALGPSALGPSVLGPSVLGPSVLGPFALGPSVLAPSVLAPSAPRAAPAPMPAQVRRADRHRIEGRGGCLDSAQRGRFPVKPVLEGTVALVTGASSGIGAAAVTALAAQGAAVALAARRTDRLETLAADVRDQGGTALVLEADITDQRQAAAAVERTVTELGRLDTLINNAGVMLLGPAAGAPLSEWQRMVDLNVLGLLYATHAALPHLLRAAEGEPRQVADIVNISSVAGRHARTGNGVYALTKFGVGAFSESLRQEFAKRHLRVSLVEPGATATELLSHNRPEIVEGVRSQLGARMEAADIADAITYIVTRPRHAAVNEILIRPTEQER